MCVCVVFDKNEKIKAEDTVSRVCVCVCLFVIITVIISNRKKIIPLNRKVETRERRREVYICL